MSSTWSHVGSETLGKNREFDDAEKGVYQNMQRLPVLPPTAMLNEKKEISTKIAVSPVSPSTPSQMTPAPLKPVQPSEPPKKSPPPKKRASRWIRFQLWFNTYRKFFTFVTLLNLVGIIMAALDRFPYAKNHLGALVLGNLLCAILMRNELFLRFLYLISIHGLRRVR